MVLYIAEEGKEKGATQFRGKGKDDYIKILKPRKSVVFNNSNVLIYEYNI